MRREYNVTNGNESILVTLEGKLIFDIYRWYDGFVGKTLQEFVDFKNQSSDKKYKATEVKETEYVHPFITLTEQDNVEISQSIQAAQVCSVARRPDGKRTAFNGERQAQRSIREYQDTGKAQVYKR